MVLQNGHSVITGMRVGFAVVIVIALAVSGSAQQWDKYISKKERKDIIKRSVKVSGMGAAMTGQIAASVWVTEPVARALVSDTVDRERLTPEEADQKYAQLRPEGSHCFLLTAIRLDVAPVFGRGVKASTLPNPLHRREVFLQRAENRELFSKGTVSDHQFDAVFGGMGGNSLQSTYILLLPRNDRAGKPVVRSLDDKIEIQFTLAEKKVVLDYKVKDLHARLDDL